MKLTIPKPCHEDWSNMTPDEKGKFCSVCDKTVQDFTVASDEEIIDAFSNPVQESICGNFNESQLNRDLQYSYINSLFSKFAVGFVVTAGGFVSVNAQQCETKEVVVKQRGIIGKVAPQPVKKDTVDSFIVLGGVYSEKISNYKPLYVMDGKIISEKKFKTIDSNSIKAMNVLKGNSATTMYGKKGKNGVILVTTKKK
ncbi:hypothetical protein [Chryseobacterium sp. JUb7]|uniref:hypothetical protein n=1 Tax=Chryseobacterium sp. JUb7 TaxID=2940599 RepID=UPI00216A2D74|nr:hypothetical protein [Chryseobacterium sp. JUb7]MCS3532182.1 TonB-dependent SusC/RagA subfamily outer membrane receptor [Chryseobacterium sp. JUb7]